MKLGRCKATAGIAKASLATVFGSMPPLSHNPTGEFSWDRSEVARWLLAQPGARALLFNLARNAGAISYDREAGKWVGCNHTHSNMEAPHE